MSAIETNAKTVFDNTSPSIVVVLKKDENGEKLGHGSGVIVDEGVVVTN